MKLLLLAFPNKDYFTNPQQLILSQNLPVKRVYPIMTSVTADFVSVVWQHQQLVAPSSMKALLAPDSVHVTQCT